MLAAIEPLDEAEDPRRCECGNPKVGDCSACARCLYLDGPTAPMAEVIWALRTGPMTGEELCAYLDGRDWAGVWRQIKRLMAQGRVRRYREGRGRESVCYYSLTAERARAA